MAYHGYFQLAFFQARVIPSCWLKIYMNSRFDEGFYLMQNQISYLNILNIIRMKLNFKKKLLGYQKFLQNPKKFVLHLHPNFKATIKN